MSKLTEQVKIYSASPSDMWPPVDDKSFCVDFVLASDYAALKAERDQLAAECAALKKSEAEFNDYCRDECAREGYDWEDDFTETPATDRLLAEQRAQAHKEGAHFVANRMLAAWEAGFIEDTAKNAADIARMILTSTEFMADAPDGDFDRSFADGVLEGIAAQLRNEVKV